MLPKANFLILACILIITVKCDFTQVLQPGCPPPPNDEYIANNAYKYFYDRLGRGIDITSASLVDWNERFQPNDDSHRAFKNQVYKFKYSKTQASDGSGCAVGTPYPYLGSVKCFNSHSKYLNFNIKTQADLIDVLHYIYSSHEGFERKSWMDNVSVRELLERFDDGGSFWFISIGEYRAVKYNMDFTNVNCDHYLTQTFINRMLQLNTSGNQGDLYKNFIKDYGTSTISEIILGGMIITIRSYTGSSVPPAVQNESDLRASGAPIFIGGNRAALQQTQIQQGNLFDTFFSTLGDFPALIRIKTVSISNAFNIIDLVRSDRIQDYIESYVDNIYYSIYTQSCPFSSQSFFNSNYCTGTPQLAADTDRQKIAVAFSDGYIETSDEFQQFSREDAYITDFNFYFLNEPQISKQYDNSDFDWDYQDNEVSPPYLMVDTYLTSFQLFGKQEKEQVCIVVNGVIMNVNAPIPLNSEQGDFQTLWVYTTPYQDCGTFPPVVHDLPSTTSKTFNFGMKVMFQSGEVQHIGENQEASFKNENIVDFWLLYWTEELTLHYQNSNHNIHHRSVSPTYPTRARLENHRRVTRIERFLESDRDTGYRMAFFFNRGAQVYCDYSGCNLPTDLKQIKIIDESDHEINRNPYY